MRRKLRPRVPNHSTAVAYLALFVALGGTAYAAATITGADVVDESLTSADIKNLTVGTNELAFDSVQGNRIKNGGIPGGKLGASAVTTSNLKDAQVTKPKLAPPQAWQDIKAPDIDHCQPPADGYFSCVNNFGTPAPQWENDTGSFNNDASYYKDPYGVVHLKGVVCFAGNPNGPCSGAGGASRGTIFQIPPGYRPAKEWSFHTATALGEALVVVGPDGHVDYLSGNYAGVSVDGIEFRACGEPGSEACPSPAPS